MEPHPLAGLTAAIRFAPGKYSMHRSGDYLAIETTDGQPDSERSWTLDVDDPRSASIIANESNVMWMMTLGRSTERTDAPALDIPHEAEPMPASGIDVGLRLDGRAWTRVIDTPGGWEATTCTEAAVAQWWMLAPNILIGVAAQDLLAAVVVRHDVPVLVRRDVRVSPTLELSGRLHMGSSSIHLDVHATGDEDEHDEWMESELDLSDAAIASWIESGDPAPVRPDTPPPADESSDVEDEPLYDPTGGFSMYTRNGAPQEIEAEVAPGPVDFPVDAPQLGEEAAWSIDLEHGARARYDRSTGVDRVRIDLASTEPDTWHRVGGVLFGVTGSRLTALGFDQLSRSIPDEDEMSAPDIDDHLEWMRSMDWDSLATTPAFPTFGVADWTGPVSGGPHPGNTSDDDHPNRQLNLRFATDDSPSAPSIDVESSLHAEIHDMAIGGHDEHAMWLAHTLRRDELQGSTTQKEAEQAFRDLELYARTLAEIPWASTELIVDDESMPVRIRSCDAAWVALGKIDGTFVTVRGDRFEPSDVRLTRVDDLSPFIAAGRAQHQRHLAMMDGAPATQARASDDDRALVRMTSQVFDALPGSGIIGMIAPEVLARHGGAERYRRLLSVYQSVRLANFGGGHGGRPTMSADGARAITTMNVRTAGAGGGTMMAVAFSSTDGDKSDPPPFPEPCDADVEFDRGRLDFNLHFVRRSEEWLLETDLLAHFQRLFGPPEDVIKPEG